MNLDQESLAAHAAAFDEDYFLRGVETGKSLYSQYRWMPDLTLPMAQAIIDHLGMDAADTVLDFGCARGYVVRAFRELGREAYGFDVSEWAVENADTSVDQFLTTSPEVAFKTDYDWIIAKDVLEHIPLEQCAETVGKLVGAARKGIFVVVPLSDDGEAYVVPYYDKDVTHVCRLTLAEWASMFMWPGLVVEARYRLKGVKDNYSGWPNGNGFLTARRIGE